jgi:soluble lytic murein transglycosylase
MGAMAAATYGSNKNSRYGRSRARRRALAIGLLVFAVVVALVPFLFRAPDAVRRTTHPLEYEAGIRQAGEEFGVEPTLIAGVVYAESRFGHESESVKGAYGLMQILPSTADFISERSGIEGDYRDPETNLRMGAWYLNYLDGRYLGDERLMLAAYNSGEGRVDGWLQDEGFDVRRDIPFQETRQYVVDVLEAQKEYEELYGRDLDRRS